jgi:phosphoribosylamine--glycine ligase
MLRMQSDLVAHCLAAMEGKLDQETTRWDQRAALGVVLAAGGYPGSYGKGAVISGLPQGEEEGRKVFHAGTAEQAGQVVTSGGRVLCATALGGSVSEAQQRAYELTGQIKWDGVYYHSDIGYRAVAREQER